LTKIKNKFGGIKRYPYLCNLNQNIMTKKNFFHAILITFVAVCFFASYELNDFVELVVFMFAILMSAAYFLAMTTKK